MSTRHPEISFLNPLDDRVVADLEARAIPRTVNSHWSDLAEHAALARVADHYVAEHVAQMRRVARPWSEIARELGVSTQAAQQRFGKLPPAPELYVHKVRRTGRPCFIRLRRDRTAWGCGCGEHGQLD